MKKILPIVLYSGILSLQGSVGTLNQDVKIREYPDMKSKVVATRKKGKNFEILDTFESKKDNLWYLTEKGYIYYQFIDLDEPFIKTNERSQEYFEKVVEQLQTRPFETIVTKEEIIKEVYETNISLPILQPIIQPEIQQQEEVINPDYAIEKVNS